MHDIKQLAALAALADPTRRALFERLLAEPTAVGELVPGAGISQPAVSQHLRVLREAGLVWVERRGSARIYHARREGLARLRAYIDRLWRQALEARRRLVIESFLRPSSAPSSEVPTEIIESSFFCLA